MQTSADTACIGDQTGNGGTERYSSLLNRSKRRRGHGFLAVFCPAHDTLCDKGPRGADADPYQRDRREQAGDRPGRHQRGNSEETHAHCDWSRNDRPSRPFFRERGHRKRRTRQASDAPATMYPAGSGSSPCSRCRNSGTYIPSGL